jgi:hypothetical protein
MGPPVLPWYAPSDRVPYVRQVAHAVKHGGYVIVSSFGPEGPTQCSGLAVLRYDADALHGEFGAYFTLLGSSKELHQTPFGTIQQFLYCYCRVDQNALRERRMPRFVTSPSGRTPNATSRLRVCGFEPVIARVTCRSILRSRHKGVPE